MKHFTLGLFVKDKKQAEFVRCFVAERSSNGNGTSTTLPRVVEGLSIGGMIEVGFFALEIAGRALGCDSQPGALIHIILRTVCLHW